MVICPWFNKGRHGVNSFPELELIMNSNPGIAIDYLKIVQLELINTELELKFPTKKVFNPQINLPFNFLIQKYFFHGNPTCNINYLE